MRKVLILFVALFICISAQAQFSGIGLRAGLNISTINDYIMAESKMGFHAGAIVDFDINDYFYLESGLYVSQKGCKSTVKVPEEYSNGYVTTDNFNSYYLELPILASLRIPVMENGFLLLNIGPAFSYGVGGKTQTDTTYYKEQPPGAPYNSSHTFETFNSTNGFKHFDIGAIMGVGFKWREFSFHFNYDYSFLVLNEQRTFMGSNGVIMFSLGYTFNLKDD